MHSSDFTLKECDQFAVVITSAVGVVEAVVDRTLEYCRPLIVITGSKHCSLPHLWPFRKGPALVDLTAIEVAPRLATRASMEQGLDDSAGLIVLLTKGVLSREYCQMEIRHAKRASQGNVWGVVPNLHQSRLRKGVR